MEGQRSKQSRSRRSLRNRTNDHFRSRKEDTIHIRYHQNQSLLLLRWLRCTINIDGNFFTSLPLSRVVVVVVAYNSFESLIGYLSIVHFYFLWLSEVRRWFVCSNPPKKHFFFLLLFGLNPQPCRTLRTIDEYHRIPFDNNAIPAHSLQLH